MAVLSAADRQIVYTRFVEGKVQGEGIALTKPELLATIGKIDDGMESSRTTITSGVSVGARAALTDESTDRIMEELNRRRKETR